jgi:hypothetical protein
MVRSAPTQRSEAIPCEPYAMDFHADLGSLLFDDNNEFYMTLYDMNYLVREQSI